MGKEFDLQPINDKVLVEYRDRSDDIRDTTSLLIADPKFEGIPNKGEVLAVPKGCTLVKPGDVIHYQMQSPTGFEWKGKKIIPVPIDCIMGVYKDEA